MKMRRHAVVMWTVLAATAGISCMARADSPTGAIPAQNSPAAPQMTMDPYAYGPGDRTRNPSRMLTLDEAPAATESTSSSEELAKKLQNPVADLISVPLQFNTDFGIGQKNATRTVLNIQPVVPISITQDWNVIVRTIVPVIYAESPADGVPYEFGLGDITQSFFFSPKRPVGGWILGVGPVFLWPTATDDMLGSGQFGAGPTAVALQQQHGWTYGVLANHIWSYAGDTSRNEVNATFIQPFVSYTFPTYTSLTLNTETTYDWRHDQFTVPINLIAGQLLKVGKQPFQLFVGGRYYAEGPSGGPEWGVRFGVTFLFPK